MCGYVNLSFGHGEWVSLDWDNISRIKGFANLKMKALRWMTEDHKASRDELRNLWKRLYPTEIAPMVDDFDYYDTWYKKYVIEAGYTHNIWFSDGMFSTETPITEGIDFV